MSEPVQIDVRRLIAGKNPGLSRALPPAAIRFLERLVHVRELNRCLRLLHEEVGVEFARSALEFLGARVEAIGEENLISASRPLIVANHPLGGLDGLALIDIVGRYHDLVVLPVNDLLMSLPNLRSVFVPINKHGSNRAYREQFNRAFTDADAVVHFPAGLCSRRKGRRVRDLDWQKSFVPRARHTGRTLVPAYVEGANSAFFYNLARLRRLSGIRANIEMIFLVDEMFKQRDKTIRVTFGRAIPPDQLSEKADPWQFARALKIHTYRLAEDPDAIFEPPNHSV